MRRRETASALFLSKAARMDLGTCLTLRLQVDEGGDIMTRTGGGRRDGGRFPDNGGLVKGAVKEQDTGETGRPTTDRGL